MRKLTERNVQQMVRGACSLPPEIADFSEGRQMIVSGERSRGAQRIVNFMAPLLDEVDWQQGPRWMDQRHFRSFAETARTIAAYEMAVRLRKSNMRGLALEASTAGVDLPTFTRQVLMTITRAYPQLYTLQLFGVLPMAGPTARVHFKDYLFDSNFTGSSPNIAIGDRTDDMTKWNPDYFLVPEGTQANALRETRRFMTVTAQDYRITSEWTDQYADDSAAVYDDDVDASQAASRAWNMSRVIDRNMLTTALAAVPAANKTTWSSQPAASPNYSALSPSEKLSYDEGIYRDGILSVQHKIRISRKYNSDAEVTWGVCGNDFAYAISRLSMFHPVQTSSSEFQLEQGPIRDLGTLKGVNIRFIVDPQMSVSGNTNVCLLGHKPMQKDDVGIYWNPYINLQPTRDFYDPTTGKWIKAVRSRFAITAPDTNQEAASSQLADIYGLLTVTVP
jgi:hypothetical protein